MALALRRSSRNLLPRPLPSWAPGTSPATSMMVVGTSLAPPTHFEFLGAHVTPNSLHGHRALTYATPLFAPMVVNG